MADIIQLLPDSVANQIAAGEVVQRPASVVKELVENAIDAGATDIHITIVDAGRTLIQIVDNGKGMSETDARMALERHATSKIRTAKDIFAIRSMGFRGEALASIVAVAHVELKTKRKEDEIGTHIIIKGSEVESQEPISFQTGTLFQVKNLFYNIPARRKFLRTNETELKYILAEIYHAALGHPHIAFTVYKDGDLHAKYPATHLKQRIITIFGKRFEKSLLSIESESSICKIHGFIGTPDTAKKHNFNQYLFVNNRFFKQRSFQNAVIRAYGNLILPQEYPPFFIFIEVDPAHIDVNIHPTKTEIKFVDEYSINSIIESAVKYSLGKSNIVPSLDFTDDTDYNDMFSTPQSEIKAPSIRVNTNYNPFASHKADVKNWEQLFEDFENQPDPDIPEQTFASALHLESSEPHVPEATCLQIQKKYIVTQGKTGLLLIDIKRAHSRILFEQFLQQIQTSTHASQKTLLPIQIEVTHSECVILKQILPELQSLGFDIEEFGSQSFVIQGCPSSLETTHVESIIRDFIYDFNENHTNITEKMYESVAKSMAKTSALYRNVHMQQDEMQVFISQLFQCESHSLSADGKVAVVLLEYDEIFKKFN
ncbi:MAG: DNA mismatch repair endonuclease MutL [Bacteroidales bacterium]|nr:DNA mismatch repair endonuclease MutL [Bacteroidales bacterium]